MENRTRNVTGSVARVYRIPRAGLDRITRAVVRFDRIAWNLARVARAMAVLERVVSPRCAAGAASGGQLEGGAIDHAEPPLEY
jgi:hypothetical protein